MKKKKKYFIPLLYSLFLLYTYIIFLLPKSNEVPELIKTELPVNATQNSIYHGYYLTFQDMLNSKNFEKTFSLFSALDYEIKKLYTVPNEKYNKQLSHKLKEYSFVSMNHFVKHYINALKKYQLEEEIQTVNVYGIKIQKVLLYTSSQNIERMKQLNPAVHYTKKED